jgi:hypothetical protein
VALREGRQGGVSADQVVGGPLRQLATDALAAGTADDWFFVRYPDAFPHLRDNYPRLVGTLGSATVALGTPPPNRPLRSSPMETFERVFTSVNRSPMTR